MKNFIYGLIILASLPAWANRESGGKETNPNGRAQLIEMPGLACYLRQPSRLGFQVRTSYAAEGDVVEALISRAGPNDAPVLSDRLVGRWNAASGNSAELTGVGFLLRVFDINEQLAEEGYLATFESETQNMLLLYCEPVE